MAPRRDRPLTAGERAALSPGLEAALHAAGAAPVLRDGVHPAAMVAALWRGGRPPVLTRGDVIWWSGVPADLSVPGLEGAMSVLQHELQHVLDYAEGWLSAVGYLLDPSHWTYAWRIEPGRPWDAYGAEQRASMVEALWLAEHGLAGHIDTDALIALIPWARRFQP